MHNVHIVQFVSLPTKQAKGSRQKNGRFTVSLAVRGAGVSSPGWLGGKKNLKSGISTLTANILANFHCFHQSGAFLEPAMHKFSEFVEKLKKIH